MGSDPLLAWLLEVELTTPCAGVVDHCNPPVCEENLSISAGVACLLNSYVHSRCEKTWLRSYFLWYVLLRYC